MSSRPHYAPAPTPRELAALARRYAVPFSPSLPAQAPPGRVPAAGRAIRLAAGPDFEVWLRTWSSGETTGLHDRGAAGALVVVAGQLTEHLPTGWSDGWMYLRPVEHAAGSVAAFGRHHVHELANRGDGPTVTVHACAVAARPTRYYAVVAGDLVGTSRPDYVQAAPSPAVLAMRPAS